MPPVIDYLQKIINIYRICGMTCNVYARLVHLLAHYELGNTDIMESLVRSVYRFNGQNGKS